MPQAPDTLITYGCTDSLAFNYDVTSIEDDGSCITSISGCTDSTAFNYNSIANTPDNESCIAFIEVFAFLTAS